MQCQVVELECNLPPNPRYPQRYASGLEVIYNSLLYKYIINFVDLVESLKTIFYCVFKRSLYENAENRFGVIAFLSRLRINQLDKSQTNVCGYANYRLKISSRMNHNGLFCTVRVKVFHAKYAAELQKFQSEITGSGTLISWGTLFTVMVNKNPTRNVLTNLL